MKNKIGKRLLSLVLITGMMSSLFVREITPKSVVAKSTVKQEDAVRTVSDGVTEADTPTVTGTYDPAVATFDAYEERNAGEVYEAGKLTVSIGGAKVEQEESGGIMVRATGEAIEGGEITFTQSFDFSAAKPGYVIVNGLSERKKEAVVSVYLDQEQTPIGSVTIPKQRGKDKWDYSRNFCADIRDKNITGTHTIRLKFTYGKLSAAEKKAETKLLLRSVLFTAFDIPTVHVNIDESDGTIAEMNNDPNHQTECYGSMSVNVPADYVSEYGGSDSEGTYELEYIRGRGNSTWGPKKKPYRIKLDKKADLFGMGADKNWVMLANYYDYTMLRNKYTYWLGDQLGMEFTPQCIFVNFLMNGEYLGSYYLCEHVRVGKARVNVDNLEDEPDAVSGSAVTGGYLLSLDSDDGEHQAFATSRGQQFLIERPDYGDNPPVEEQVNYISDYCQKVEDAIYGKDGKDADGVPFTDYLDLQSAVDYYLIQEFSLNGDGFISGSTYLYKKRDGKLYWGPLWDFDYVAWGATEYSHNQVEGLYHNNQTWYAPLMKNKTFLAKLKERWEVLKTILERSIADGGAIDRLSKQQYLSQKANYQVTTTIGMDESMESGGDCDPNTLSYEKEVARLKAWINDRIDWLDANIGKNMSSKSVVVTFKNGNKVYKKVPVINGEFMEGQMPKDPTKKGYRFKGWVIREKDGSESEFTGFGILKSMTVYATWSRVDKVKGGPIIFFPFKKLYYPNDEGCGGYIIPFGSYPNDVTADKIKWNSSNKKLVSVKNGVLTCAAGKTGTVTITAKYKKTKISCKVTLTDWSKLENLHDVTLKKKSITIRKKSYKPLPLKIPSAKMSMAYIQDTLKYYSENEKVVEVDKNGVVHGLKKGNATIVLAYEGALSFCRVKVK